MPLIIFEGLDKCGKSTHSKHLVDNLNKNGYKASLLRFPDRTTPSGMKCDEYLRGITKFDDLEINDIFAENRAEKRDYIIKALENDEYIICDRYTLSGIAYSSSKGFDIKRCAAPDANTLLPDLIIYCHSEEHMTRQEFGDEIYEHAEAQQRVQQQFEKLLKQLQGHVKIEYLNTDLAQSINEERVLNLAKNTAKPSVYRSFSEVSIE